MRNYRPKPVKRDARQQGVALVVALSVIAILAVMVADMHDNVRTSYEAAVAKRDELRAEYLAISGINLTRLLVANEPIVRQAVGPLLQAMIQRTPPQLPVWEFANEALAPFAKYEATAENATGLQLDLSSAEGLGDIPGEFDVAACAENVKINVNKPLTSHGDAARQQIATQLFSLLGGYQSPSPYDPLFSQRDADNQLTSRLDIVSAMIDWWDLDVQATRFDPGAGQVTSVGSEDDYYRNLDDAYTTKNAPYDSLEELRLIRGVGDDFFATFIAPTPNDPCDELLTVYSTGALNPNMAKPEALLAAVCATVPEQLLCSDPTEGARFVQLLSTVRSMFPVPWFSNPGDFINFLEGKGGPQDLYAMLQSFVGQDPSLLFRPLTLTAEQRTQLQALFTTTSYILTIQSTGHVGRARVRIRSVVNFNPRWSPPPPNTITMPATGIYHYWRVN